MKRTYGKASKTAFIIFALLVVGAVIGLAVLVYNNVDVISQNMEVPAGSYIYDTNDDIIQLAGDSTVTKKYDGNYYLMEDGQNAVSLGEHPLIYNNSSGSLEFLGSSYRAYPDGTIELMDDNLKLSDFNDNAIYKLCDRLYVVIGPEIFSHDGTIKSNGFIRVSLDKTGNALFVSNGTNCKTLIPVVLQSGDLYFDV